MIIVQIWVAKTLREGIIGKPRVTLPLYAKALPDFIPVQPTTLGTDNLIRLSLLADKYQHWQEIARTANNELTAYELYLNTTS